MLLRKRVHLRGNMLIEEETIQVARGKFTFAVPRLAVLFGKSAADQRLPIG